ncbi:MAG: hypothetical protein V4760_19760 [Bdellovibrionota bacterium]
MSSEPAPEKKRTNRWMITCAIVVVIIGALAWALFEEDFEGETETAEFASQSQAPRLALWSEFIPYAVLETQLIEIASHELDLYVAFNASEPDFDGFARLVRKAKAMGIGVRPWLLLDVKDGYWFNKWNVEKNAEFALTFLDEMAKRDVEIEWITFDIEPPQSLVAKIQDAFAKRHFGEALGALKASARSASLLRAIEQTKSLVAKLHVRRVKVHAVTTNFVLNDSSSLRIQNALGTPIGDVPFDEVSFMVYRPELEKILGEGLSSRIVKTYSKRAKKKFGVRAAIDIGEAGFVPFPVPFQGFREPAELQTDLAAVRSVGIDRIHIYSLDGLTELGVATWLAPTRIKPIPRIDLKATLFVKSISLLRNLLPEAE